MLLYYKIEPFSSVAAGHTMAVKERHYEKVGEDFEQVHENSGIHPVFVRGGRLIDGDLLLLL